MDTDRLAAMLDGGLRPKLVYLVSNFSNPSGATLAPARRRRLAQLADQHGFVVIEDDQYGRLRFRGEHLAPIASMTDQVVYLSGFSKVVAPGLRVGYLVAPGWLTRPLVLAKQAADLAAPSLGQRIVTRLLERDGWLDHHVAALCDLYHSRADALMDACPGTSPRAVGAARARRRDVHLGADHRPWDGRRSVGRRSPQRGGGDRRRQRVRRRRRLRARRQAVVLVAHTPELIEAVHLLAAAFDGLVR